MNWKMKLEPAIIWKLETCQRITSKRYSTSMGRHLSPRYDQVLLVSGYPVLTAVNWSQDWCAICLQYQSSCAPKLTRKCEIEHWLPCGADGRAGGLRAVYGHVITKFSGMGRFTYPWCSAGALRAPELRYYLYCHHLIKKNWTVCKRHFAIKVIASGPQGTCLGTALWTLNFYDFHIILVLYLRVLWKAIVQTLNHTLVPSWCCG